MPRENKTKNFWNCKHFRKDGSYCNFGDVTEFISAEDFSSLDSFDQECTDRCIGHALNCPRFEQCEITEERVRRIIEEQYKQVKHMLANDKEAFETKSARLAELEEQGVSGDSKDVRSAEYRILKQIVPGLDRAYAETAGACGAICSIYEQLFDEDLYAMMNAESEDKRDDS